MGDNKKGKGIKILFAELRFVATVVTSGRVKSVPAVYIFPENNAISLIICKELQH